MSKYPVLFEANEIEFKTHGIGVLSDAVQCDVTEELNGIFELNMVYPSNGQYIKELKNSRLIYADASSELGCQPFRICRVTKLLSGLVNVYAQHISYDLGGIQLPPFETTSTTDGMQKVKEYSLTQNDYTFSSTVASDEDDTFSIETPKSIRAYLMGEKDSFLQAYGGEFTFDRFDVHHASRRGSDKGFRVKYGINLIDLNQEESIEKTYTGFYPYYKDEYMFMDLTESFDLMYPHEIDTSKFEGKIMYADGTFAHTKIANVDLSPYFEVAPLSTDELKEIADQYMEDNSIGIPTVSLDVRFESLRNSPEYSNVIFLEDVFLGDTIHVDFVKLGVSSSGRVNTVIYDSLRHKIKRVSIGDAKNSITDTVSTIQNAIKQSQTQINSSKKTIAKLTVETSANSANITALTERVTATETNIGYLEIDVSGHTSKLEAIAKWQDDTDSSLATIESTATENEAKIGLLVETSESGEDSVKGSVLVEAINGQSTATISADKVNLTGYVTVNSLRADGTTVIDGSRIQTGQIASKNFSDNYILLKKVYVAIEAGTYYFTSEDIGDGNDPLIYYSFTTAQTIPSGGQIRFYKESKKIETLNDAGNILETMSPTTADYAIGTDLETDLSVFFSEDGTVINLENGTIISKYFSLTENGAYFGGEIQVDYGRIGAFDISGAGLSYASVDLNDSVVSLLKNEIFFASKTKSTDRVIFRAGDILPSPYGNKDSIEIANTNGDAMIVTITTAALTGSWKATPYSDASADVSEIVTKQDLINLGLITA